MATSRDPRAIGVPGLVLVIAGAILLMLSFTAMTWYGSSAEVDSVGRITFSKLHTITNLVEGGSRAPRWYFGWAAWVLLLLVVLVGLLANLPLPGGLVLRISGFLIGIAGTLVTWYSLHQMFSHSEHGVLDNAKIGVWFAFIGYPLAGLGAIFGPGGRTIPAPAESSTAPPTVPATEPPTQDTDEPVE